MKFSACSNTGTQNGEMKRGKRKAKCGKDIKKQKPFLKHINFIKRFRFISIKITF